MIYNTIGLGCEQKNFFFKFKNKNLIPNLKKKCILKNFQKMWEIGNVIFESSTKFDNGTNGSIIKLIIKERMVVTNFYMILKKKKAMPEQN